MLYVAYLWTNMNSSEHVSNWDDLPPGEWLDNDEHGTHWYLGEDGRHWYSTDDGYRVWREEAEETPTQSSFMLQKNQIPEASSYEDASSEDEDDGEKVPTANVGSGTAIITIFTALTVGFWTWIFAMPTIEANLALYNPANSGSLPEDQIIFDGLELVQMFNTLALVLVGVMAVLAVLSLFKKLPWWSLSVLNGSLLLLLLITVYTAFSSEVEWAKGCSPEIMYCHQIELPSLLEIDSVFSAVACLLGLLVIVNGSFNSWINFDPNEEEPQPAIRLMLTSHVSIGIGFFSILMGMLMSLSVLAWTWFGSIPVTDANISDYESYATLVEKLEYIQTLNFVTVALAGLTFIFCLLAAIKKAPWWLLPTSTLTLFGLLIFTAQKSTFDGTSFVEADAFYSGSCSLLGLVIIGLGTVRALRDVDWDEYAESDSDEISPYGITSNKSFDFYDDDDDDGEEWRSKLKTIALASLILFTGLVGFAGYQFSNTDLGADPSFQVRAAASDFTNESDDILAVVDLLDKTISYRKDKISIEIQIDGGDNILCRSGDRCDFEWLEIFDDSEWTAQESIMIFENGDNLCSGGVDEVCEITAIVLLSTSSRESEILTTLTMTPS